MAQDAGQSCDTEGFVLEVIGGRNFYNDSNSKKHSEYNLFEHKIIPQRPGKDKNDNVLVFKARDHLSKHEIKQHLKKLDNINMEKVNLDRYMEVVKRDPIEARRVTNQYEKFYVMISHKISQ